MRIKYKLLIVIGIFLLILPLVLAANDYRHYVLNESSSDWIPWIATNEGKPKIDLNLLNITAGNIEASNNITAGEGFSLDGVIIHSWDDINTSAGGSLASSWTFDSHIIYNATLGTNLSIGMSIGDDRLNVNGTANITGILYAGGFPVNLWLYNQTNYTGSIYYYNQTQASGDYEYNETLIVSQSFQDSFDLNISVGNQTLLDILNITGFFYNYNTSHAIPWDYNQTDTQFNYNFTTADFFSYNMSSWNISGSYIFPKDLGLSVGIRTANPGEALEVNGNIIATDLKSINQMDFDATLEDKISLYDNRLGATDMYGLGVASGVLYFKTTGTGTYKWFHGLNYEAGKESLQVSNTTVMVRRDFLVDFSNKDFFVDDSAGFVGIGTDAPTHELNVIGDVNITEDLFLGLGSDQDYLFTSRGNSLAIQSQTAGTAGYVELYTKDGDGTDDFTFSIFGKGSPASITDSERLIIKFDVDDSQYEIWTQKLGEGTLYPLNIYTQGYANQLYLATDGNVGIGTMAPAYLLEIAKSNIGLNVSGNLYVNDTKVGIGTTTPSSKLEVSGGNITVSEGIAVRSDSTSGYAMTVSGDYNKGIRWSEGYGAFQFMEDNNTEIFRIDLNSDRILLPDDHKACYGDSCDGEIYWDSSANSLIIRVN